MAMDAGHRKRAGLRLQVHPHGVQAMNAGVSAASRFWLARIPQVRIGIHQVPPARVGQGGEGGSSMAGKAQDHSELIPSENAGQGGVLS